VDIGNRRFHHPLNARLRRLVVPAFAGDSGKVNQAKKIIGAALSALIVFASYVIVKFSLQALGLNWSGGAIGSKSNSTQVETTTASTTTSGTDSCEQKYGAQGFQCMDKSQGGACKAGLCPAEQTINAA
jgi:hypothetical protein